MAEEPSLFSRLYQYGSLLMGHGKQLAVFWIATVYSIYAAVVPIKIQEWVLQTIHVDPRQRLAIWGFGLAAFFLYAGFRAWSDEHAARQTGSAKDEAYIMRLATLHERGEPLFEAALKTNDEFENWKRNVEQWRTEILHTLRNIDAVLFKSPVSGIQGEIIHPDALNRVHNTLKNQIVADLARLEKIIEQNRQSG